MRSIVRPAVAASRSPSRALRVPGSRWAVGSSSISKSGSASRARATASRWRWPPDSAAPWAPTGVSQRSGSDSIQSSNLTRAAASASCSSVAPGRARRRLSRRDASKMCGSCGQPPILVRNLVRGVAGQVVTVERDPPRGQLREAEEHAGHRGFPGSVRTGQGDPPPRQQIEVDAVEGSRTIGPVADLSAAQPDRYRAAGQWPRRERLAHRVRRVQHRRDPAGRHAGLAELDRRGGQGRDGLEGGERGQRQHGQRNPGQHAASGGRAPRAAGRPTRSARR